MKIAITGHRPNKLGNDYILTSPLIVQIRYRIVEAIMNATANPKDLTLITGMALGIDTLFAQIAIALNVPFIAAIPFKGQHKVWNITSQIIYWKLLAKAYQIQICNREKTITSFDLFLEEDLTLVNKQKAAELMNLRNKWMVDNCDILIAVWDGSSGGTANCITYARQKEKEIVFINPKNM